MKKTSHLIDDNGLAICMRSSRYWPNIAATDERPGNLLSGDQAPRHQSYIRYLAGDLAMSHRTLLEVGDPCSSLFLSNPSISLEVVGTAHHERKGLDRNTRRVYNARN